MDDSVVRESGEMLRRSRGYVPDAVQLPPGFRLSRPCAGADMKNTFCLVRDDSAVLSQHFGDLTDEGVETQWRNALRLMQAIYDFTPQQVVADAHTGYRASHWAQETGLARHNRVAPPRTYRGNACRAWLAARWGRCDCPGAGRHRHGGERGAVGGECLRVNYREVEHLGGLPAVALPGGDLAATQPWRNLLAQMLAFVPDWQYFPETAVLQRQNWPVLARAIARNINAPLASSPGDCLMPSPVRWTVRRCS
jgi:hydrogenase maturation protein HypF